MMKRTVARLIAALLLVAMTSCGTALPEELPLDPGQPVFDTEREIERITFHSDFAPREVDVPAEDQEEIIAWLASYRIEEKVGETMPPGTGAVSVTIAYADGTSVKNSLSTIRVDGRDYSITGDNAPECYAALMNEGAPAP